jgi:hypothetical protein
MFGSTALEVAIAVIFVFLLFSLVVSALNELWLSRFHKRADFLAEGLGELLQDPERVPFHHWLWFLRKKLPPSVARLYEHGLISALSRGKSSRPSYIDAEAFVAAMLDFIAPGSTATSRSLEDLKQGIEKIANPRLKESLVAILDAAGDDLDEFKQGLSAWFERTMERTTGWYKRYAQTWLLILGLILAIGCNVDMVRIIQVLSTDSKVRAAVVANATAYSEKEKAGQAPSPTPSPGATPGEETKKIDVPDFGTALAELNHAQLPIGWDTSARTYFCENGRINRAHLLSAIFGWFVTALAGSLGAPFWFDTLQRFINIRANGRAPGENELPTKKRET